MSTFLNNIIGFLILSFYIRDRLLYKWRREIKIEKMILGQIIKISHMTNKMTIEINKNRRSYKMTLMMKIKDISCLIS